MNPNAALHRALMAGMNYAWAKDWIRMARETASATRRCVQVKTAREYHHRYLSEIRRARELLV